MIGRDTRFIDPRGNDNNLRPATLPASAPASARAESLLVQLPHLPFSCMGPMWFCLCAASSSGRLVYAFYRKPPCFLMPPWELLDTWSPILWS